MLKRILPGLNSSLPHAALTTHLSTICALRRISCWRCGRKQSCIEKCQVCNATFDQTKINYFELFNLPLNYNLNTTDVVVSYHKLQKQFHPDKHTNDSEVGSPTRVRLSCGFTYVCFLLTFQSVKEISEKFSTLANRAYKTLLSPIDRGVYMLSLHNVPLVITSTEDPELLSDVLEIDAEIARCSKSSGLRMKKKLSIELDRCKK